MSSPRRRLAKQTLVIDASVMLKWQLNDEDHIEQALALRNDYLIHERVALVAPTLLTYELTNGLSRAERRERLADGVADEALAMLLACAVRLERPVPGRLLETARRYAITAYDAAYVALAEQRGSELWTADRPLYEAAGGSQPLVRWIGDYPLAA